MNQKLLRFILEQAENQPVFKRIDIYRALASEIRGQEQNDLLKLVEDLESIQQRAHQFIFNFSTNA